MALNHGAPVALVLLLVASVAATQLASANFADAAGFSGRAGVVCTACHTVPASPAGSLQPPAQAVLEGLPAAWEPGQSYALVLRVTGGPAALAPPQPQGGFDLSVGGGRLELPAGLEDRLRLVGTQEATYRPAGTLMREWQLTWVAPDLAAQPAPVSLWLAVLAANGNHVVASNASDGGERFDATASLQLSVPPSAAATQAWRTLPLAPPEAAVNGTVSAVRIEGRHADGNATRLLWSLDGQPWQARDTAPAWRLELPDGPGRHRLLLRSEGAGRASPDLEVVFGEPTLADSLRDAGQTAPAPAFVPLLALAIALLSFRRSTP